MRSERAHAPLTAQDWKAMAGIGAVAAISVFQSVAYYQNANIGLLWINKFVDLNLFGFHIPVGWFNSIDPTASVIAVPLLIVLWRWQERRGGEPGDLGKIAIGAWMAGFANLLLVAASYAGGSVSALVPMSYDILLGIAFIYYWPTLLALVSRAAPLSMKATLMGAIFLSRSFELLHRLAGPVLRNARSGRLLGPACRDRGHRRPAGDAAETPADAPARHGGDLAV